MFERSDLLSGTGGAEISSFLGFAGGSRYGRLAVPLAGARLMMERFKPSGDLNNWDLGHLMFV